MSDLNWQIVNVIISIVTTISSLALIAYAWPRRAVPGARWFTGLIMATGWIGLCYALEAAAGNDLNAYVTLSKFEYLGLTLIPLLWLGFSLHFSGREHQLSQTRIGWLLVIPIITIVLAFSNDFHGLIWKQPAFEIVHSTPIYEPVYGAWFWVYIIYSYIIFLAGSLVLLRRAFGEWKLYRAQAALVFVGTALPWISNIINVFDNLNPFPYLYLNAIFLSTALFCFTIALFRLRLLDIMPMAYETILNNIPDALIVADAHDRVVALNSNARNGMDDPTQDPIGKPLEEVFSRYAKQFESLRTVRDFKGRVPVDGRTVEIRVSPLNGRAGNPAGRLFILNDVTAETEIAERQQEEHSFAKTMREIGGLLNSTLDTNIVLRLLLESIGVFVAYRHANIMMLEPDGNTLRVRQHIGYSQEVGEQLEKTGFDYRSYPLMVKAAKITEPTIIPDTRMNFEWVAVKHQENVLSFATAPIWMDDQLIGFINIEDTKVGTIRPELSNRLQIFAQQAASAVKNARLYEELQHRVEALTITQQVYKEISFSFKKSKLLELAFDAVLRISQADGGYIALSKSDSFEIVNYYGQYTRENITAFLNAHSGIVQQAIDSHLAVISLEAAQPKLLKGTEAQIVLPLYAFDMDDQDVLHGIIMLETRDAARFTEDRFQLLRLIADRTAIALENMRLVDALQSHATELEIANERVIRLEQLKSDMIRIAAHDLKNPLGVILSYLQMLKDPVTYMIETEETYDLMRRSAERMLQIINDFLSLERIERAAQQKTMEPFDLSEVIVQAADEYKKRAAEKSQTLNVTRPSLPCVVNSDRAQIYEAITNLIGNAIKYTPEGGQITVQLSIQDGVAHLEVQDTGYGIPDDQQSNLFKPFFRSRTRETADIEGTGLGLHLTKNIIERQGGTLIFHSIHGKGSTFGFKMPLYQEEVVEAAEGED